MARLLLTSHSLTLPRHASLHGHFCELERILAAHHTVIRAPLMESWPPSSRQAWAQAFGAGCDAIVGAGHPVMVDLRRAGWKGTIVYDVLGELPRGASALRSVFRHLRKTDLVWCASRSDRCLFDVYFVDDGARPQVRMVPWGVDTELFRPLAAAARHRLRSSLGIAARDLILMYSGRITVEKNFPAILEALRALRLGGVRARLLVVGRFEDVPFLEFGIVSNDLEGMVRRLIETWELDGCVQFLPWSSAQRLNELYGVADAFVNLTLHHDENFGHAQVEAMSAGLPCVVTGWGGLKDTVVDGETGYVCDTWWTSGGVRIDLPRAVAGLRRLASDEQRREALGVRARARAIAVYGRATYEARVLSMVTSALATRCQARSEPRLTPTGLAIDTRFSVESVAAGGRLGVRAVYRSWDDPIYRTIASAYASRTLDSPSPADGWRFRAVRGQVRGNVFESADPLWPAQVTLQQGGADALIRLSRSEATPWTALPLQARAAVPALVKKGLVGISTPLV